MRKPAETVPVGAWSNFPPRCYEKADTDANKVPYLFPFEAGVEDDRLEDYALFMQLPGWLPGTA